MIIVTEKTGQLANRLFLFAHLIAFAEKNGLSVINPSFEEYAVYFQATDRDLFCKFPPSLLVIPATPQRRHKLFQSVTNWQQRIVRRKLLPWAISIIDVKWNEICDMNNDRFIKLALRKTLLLNGWRFRDNASFDNYASEIRTFFTPTQQIQQNVKHLIGNCRQGSDLLIGVHIRRGDYREHRGGIFCFEDREYMLAMRKIQQLLPERSITFLICSNEPVSEEAFRDVPYKLSTNQMVEDLYALAQCDYLIGPPSTFSHWASFYGQVPLYPMRSSSVLMSMNQFTVANGSCDIPEALAECSDFEVS